MLFEKFRKLLAGEHPQEDTAERILQLANAVLLVEISHADFETDPRELRAAASRLAGRYTLSEVEADTLLRDALAEHKQSVSLHEYLSAINRGMGQDEKTRLLEDLWVIAYADGRLDCHEEYQVRKIADLLHVPHVRFIQTKHRVRQ